MIPLGSQSLTRRRFAATTIDTNGYPVAGASTDSTITGAWQPLNGIELQTLPEGERQRDPRKLYTTGTLRTASQHDDVAADHVSADGSVFYEVRKVETWAQIIGHTKATLLRVQESE